jgi:hypothetical protein
MKLFEVYEDMMFAEAWNKLEEILQSGLFQEEGDSKLNQLLEIANLFIFEAFGISPDQEGKYFISGSARLFKHPRLLNVLHDHDPNFELTIGDLDVVVPGEKEWKTLYNNYTNKDSKFIKKLRKKIGKSPEEIKNVFLKQESNWKKGIYRPGNGDGGMNLVNADIEAFDVWDPSQTKNAKDFKSDRGQKDFLRDAVNVGGHYYMNIYDVFDYKSKLNRDKEKKIVEFLKQYLSSDETPENAEKLFRQIGEVVGKKK